MRHSDTSALKQVHLPTMRISIVAAFAIWISCICSVVTSANAADALASRNAEDVLQAESSIVSPPSCNLSAYGIQEPKIVPPEAHVDDFGAKGDGVTDDGVAIRAAIASLKNGGTVVFTKGKTYRKIGKIVLDHPGIRLWGYGATLYAFIPKTTALDKPGATATSIVLLAPNTAIYGMTIVSNLRVRLAGHPDNAAIQVVGPGQEVLDTRIEYTVVGIFVRGGSQFSIARNVVYRTTADGIHMTSGSRDGKVVCNAVRENGDDMIAVVNYGEGPPNIGNFLIEANDVADNYWARGITVVGGSNVTIRKNHIRGAASIGIAILSEASYKTADVRQVLVEDNDITEVQTKVPPYNPLGPSRRGRQGGIDISGSPPTHQVAEVLVRNNRIQQVLNDGIFVHGNSDRIGLENNAISNVGRNGIMIDTSPGTTVGCSANTLNGAPTASSACASTLPRVTGATF